MKIVTIIGTRPQFIKAAPVSRAIQKSNQEDSGSQIQEIIVHTGQHYDHNMSQIFFDELKIREPDYDLGVGSGNHGEMTGNMLAKIEKVLLEEKPDRVLVYGDTNSTLAGALAAVKLHIPVGHVEAGLRSFNRQMPEEINRILTDHMSSLLFCPTDAAVNNLKIEGLTEGVFKVGDVMFDSFLFNKSIAEKKSAFLSDLGLKPKEYCLVTVHREDNTTNSNRLTGIFEALDKLANAECPFIAPLHPRTANALNDLGNDYFFSPHVRILKPVSYLDMILLETHAKVILTDSGGVQKEAYFAQVPCITLRNETEWAELVQHGFNLIAGSDTESICRTFAKMLEGTAPFNQSLYGNGTASESIVRELCSRNALTGF
jgi:UDP-N-acetylglucosamine 2-epimerase